MSNNSDLKTFPSNVAEAIALLYIQNQNLSGKSPVEIYRMYQVALAKIYETQKADLDAKRNQP